MYRRSLQAIAAVLVIGATCFTAFASGTPDTASAKPPGNGNGLPGNVEAMKEAFEDYLKAVEDTAKLFVESDTFRLDDAHAVGAYDLISAFLHASNRNNLTSSAWAPRAFPPRRSIQPS
jgi:hypothetical protein